MSVASSFSEQEGKENKHVVIYIPRDDACSLVFVSVDSLIPPETPPPSDHAVMPPCEKSGQQVCGEHLNHSMCFICTTSVGGKRSQGPSLYMFGGCNYESDFVYACKNMYCYDLHEYPNIGNFKPCNDMICGLFNCLSVQVGDDRFYVLSYKHVSIEAYNNGVPELVVQEYNLENDKWTLVGDSGDISNKCDGNEWVYYNITGVPHVVIGRKLHVSFGEKSSFTFDTDKHVWEPSKLFETFWTSKKSGLSPSDFYGGKVWENSIRHAKKKNFAGVGGKPFGFYGRGILWDKDILLGVHYGPNCPLVAFLLDDETGRVVRSQPLTLNNLVMYFRGCLHADACLVDLGRDGYFGLLHLVPARLEKADNPYYDCYELSMELVTFKVSRLAPQEMDDDHFLKCEFQRKDFVARHFEPGPGNEYNAFCV